MSSCFTVYVYTYVHCSLTSRLPFAFNDSVGVAVSRSTRLSLIFIPGSVTLPVFVTLTVYSISSPTSANVALSALFSIFTPGDSVNVIVSVVSVVGKLFWAAVTVILFVIGVPASIFNCVTSYVFVNVPVWPTPIVTFSATVPSLSSATFTSVSVTLPVFFTVYVYVTVPGDDHTL